MVRWKKRAQQECAPPKTNKMTAEDLLETGEGILVICYKTQEGRKKPREGKNKEKR